MRRARTPRWLWPALAGAGIAALGATAWAYTVDDAFILARYATRLAGGRGYTMNDGPPTDGVTGPLALIPALLGQWLLGDPVLAQKALGLACGAIAAGLAVCAAPRQARPGATLLVLAGGALPIWSVAGLETGLATLAVTVLGVSSIAGGPSGKIDLAKTRDGGSTTVGVSASGRSAGSGSSGKIDLAKTQRRKGNDTGWTTDAGSALASDSDSDSVSDSESESVSGPASDSNSVPDPRGVSPFASLRLCAKLNSDPSPERRAAITGATAGVLAWLRPELAPVAFVALALASRSPRRAVYAWAPALLGLVSVIIFRVVLFDEPLPLSASAKPAELGHGLAYLGGATLLVYGGLGVLWIALALRRPSTRGLGLLLGAHALAVVLAGGDWMPGARLFAPVVPLYAMLAASVIVRLPSSRSIRLGALGLTALVPAIALVLSLAELPAVEASRRGPGAELAAYLREHTRRVALVDVGYLAYASEVEVLDLGGVTDPAVGRLAGGHVDKHVDVGLLAEHAPDAIVIHSRTPPRVEDGRLVAFVGHPVEHRVARMPWVRAHFRVARVIRYAPDYWYVVMLEAPKASQHRASRGGASGGGAPRAASGRGAPLAPTWIGGAPNGGRVW